MDREKKHAAVSYLYLGIIAIDEKDHKKAVDYFEKSREIDPKRPEVYYHLGKAHLEGGRISEGQRLLNNYLKLSPAGRYASDAKKLVALPQKSVSMEKKSGGDAEKPEKMIDRKKGENVKKN
jgi:tetratricopeptide (TPR) repeat protein